MWRDLTVFLALMLGTFMTLKAGMLLIAGLMTGIFVWGSIIPFALLAALAYLIMWAFLR